MLLGWRGVRLGQIIKQNWKEGACDTAMRTSFVRVSKVEEDTHRLVLLHLMIEKALLSVNANLEFGQCDNHLHECVLDQC